MPGPCKICGVTSPMVKTKKGGLTFACPTHRKDVEGK